MPVLPSIEYILLGGAGLLFVSILASKASDKMGVPALLLFLLVGMVAGSDGLGGIRFDNAWVAQSIGVVALVFILFSGGLDTDWAHIRPVLWQGLALSTVGILVTTALVGWFTVQFLHFTLMEGLLMGAIVSSTDAAAVFSVLRSGGSRLKGRMRELIELESGSNDAMAVFLVTSFISLATTPERSVASLVPHFVLEMGVGLAVGYGMGKTITFIINRLRLEYEGLYPVLTTSLVLMTYGGAASLDGNGFLAVYVTGLVMGNTTFYHKRTLMRFHDGLSWMMQIAMFLVLGLLVTPTRILPIIPVGLAIAMFLGVIARPASVYLSLLFTKLSHREKLMISWMGLRGAAPIILATFPLLAGLGKAQVIYDLVFFIVFSSVVVQGTFIQYVGRWLGVSQKLTPRELHAQRFGTTINEQSELTDMLVPYNSPVVGKSVMDMHLPPDALVMLISREEGTIVPNGRTVIEGGDVLMVLAEKAALAAVQATLSGKEL